MGVVVSLSAPHAEIERKKRIDTFAIRVEREASLNLFPATAHPERINKEKEDEEEEKKRTNDSNTQRVANNSTGDTMTRTMHFIDRWKLPHRRNYGVRKKKKKKEKARPSLPVLSVLF